MRQVYYKEFNLEKGYLIDNYGNRNLILGKVNDPRLTDDMYRTRSGTVQMFRRDYNDRKFTTIENADVVITPESKHHYIEIFNGEWYWINGCYVCSGARRNWMCYIECEEHDVCSVCSISRKENKGSCWDKEDGWFCSVCKNKKHEKEKQEALEAFDEDEFCEWDYENLDNPKCPYCDFVYDHGEHGLWEANEKEEECPRCDNAFTVTSVPSVTFNCARIENDQ